MEETSMMLVTKKNTVLVDSVASLFLKNEDYLLLSQDADARVDFLNQLGLERVVVDYLGNELEPDVTFEKKDFKVKAPKLDVGKEMGYYHRL
jgi:hypothetical protein